MDRVINYTKKLFAQVILKNNLPVFTTKHGRLKCINNHTSISRFLRCDIF